MSVPKVIFRSVLLLLSAASATTIPIITAAHLNPSGPVAATAIIAGVLCISISVTALLRKRTTNYSRSITVFSILLFSLLLFATLIHILIIPFGAYMTWLDLVATGNPQGAISFVFVLLTALGSAPLLSALASARSVSRGLAAVIAALAWNTFLAGVVYSDDMLLFLATGGAAVALAMHAVGSAGNGDDLRIRIGSGLRALLVVAAAFLIAAPVAHMHEPSGSRLIDGRLAPALRSAVLALWPQLPLLTNVPGYGSRLESRELGGRPLLSEAPLYEVTGSSERLLYLRGEVFHIYDGSSWTRSPTIRRISPSLERDEQSRFRVGSDPDSGVDPEVRLDPGAAPDLSIRVVAEFLSDVPHTLETTAFSVGERDRSFELYSRSTGFRPHAPVVVGETIELWESREADTLSPPGDYALSEQEVDVYLDLPSGLPQSVERFAATLRGSSDRETVAAIRRELTTSGTYSLNPPSRRRGEDFVDFFLFGERIGFCVHYASAATILARANGIPARYVTGHIVPPASRQNEQNIVRTVSGMRAHAWTEVFVDGEWRVLETTPAVRTVAEQESTLTIPVAEDTLTRRQLAALGLLGAYDDTDAAAGRGIAAFRSNGVSVGLLFALLAGALALIALAVPAIKRISAGPGRHLQRLATRVPPEMRPEIVGWSGWEIALRDRLALRGGSAHHGGLALRDRLAPANLRAVHLRRARMIAQHYAYATHRLTARDRRFLIEVARRARKAASRGRHPGPRQAREAGRTGPR